MIDIARTVQIEFINAMLLLLNAAKDPEDLERLYDMTELYKSTLVDGDSSMTHSLTEFALIKWEVAQGNMTNAGHLDEIRESLEEEIKA